MMPFNLTPWGIFIQVGCQHSNSIPLAEDKSLLPVVFEF